MVVFGQDEAIDSLASAIKLSRAGLKADEKPIGSFLFAGPTGVGKTEVCRQLANIMGVELLRYDMSEYMERHTVSRLIGAPPGYVGFDQGGLLTEAVTKHPHSVVLLDEIEKAHPEVFNLLLQVMDHGTLTDNNGRKADFRNVMLVMTTNAGAQDMARPKHRFPRAGPQRGRHGSHQEVLHAGVPEPSRRHHPVRSAVHRDHQDGGGQVPHRASGPARRQECHARCGRGSPRLAAREGYDEKMGARPMQRLIQERIKRPLAEDVLFGVLAKNGGTVHVTVEDGDLKVRCESSEAPAEEATAE